MKRAAAGGRESGSGAGGPGKRRSVESGSDAEITPQHLVDTQLESLLNTAAKHPSRSRTKASLKAIKSLLASVAEHDITPADCPDVVVRDPAVVLSWHPPAAVELCGSFVQSTTVSSAAVPSHTPVVDVAVQMPRSCFLAKDYLNHKYNDKRALYLNVMLRALRDSPMFASAQLDRMASGRPIITVQASADTPHLRVIPHAGEDGLAKAKLLPSRNNNRTGEGGASLPTPRYNNQVLADILMLQVEKDVQAAISSNPTLAKAMILAKIWLMQRHIHRSPGGVTPFQLGLILCYLQRTATINSEMSPWQMLRSMLLYLSRVRGVELQSAAAHPLCVTGAVIGGAAPLDNMAMYLAAFDVVLLDSTGQYNTMSSVSASGFAELVWHARLAMGVAASAEPHELLSKLFFHQLTPACMFDIRAEVTLRRPSMLPAELEDGLRESSWEELAQQHAESVVTRALGDRAVLVRTISAEATDGHDKLPGSTTLRWVVGCKINPSTAERTVDKGPPVENGQAAAEFKQFWGSKSEVRRMKDGAIVQAVIWSNCKALARRHHVIQCILSHVLQNQLAGIADPEPQIEVADGQPLDKVIFRKHHSEASWKLAYDAFERLAKKIRNSRGDGGEGVPLAIVRVVPTSARLRRCSALPPKSHALIPGCSQSREEVEPSIAVRPMGVSIEFESSGTWPSDDMMALRAIKTAMLLRLGETLKSKFGIASQPTRNHLDVFVDGFAFRVAISHSREASLIQEDITTLERAEAANEVQKPYLLARVPRGLTPAVLPALRKELAAVQLAGHFLPLHSSTVNAVMLKHSAVARSVRLAKCWCHAHMFSNHLPPQLIELLVIYCYTERGASPYGVPATYVQGFARFLQLLFQYDWEGSPLVVDVDDAGDTIDSAAVDSAWSNREPDAAAMFVVTNYDLKSVWSQGNPSAQVLTKIKSFARASAATLCAYLECRSNSGSSSGLKTLFQTPTNRFDVLIHLRNEVIPACADALNFSYKKATAAIKAGPLALPPPRAKNLQDTTDFENQVLSGFSPPARYVEELQEHFASTAIVYYDSLGGRCVGLSWLPLACVPHRGRSGLKLQMLSDGMLVNCTLSGPILAFCKHLNDTVADVAQVPSDAASGANSQSEQTVNPTLLIRNMFEILERVRALGEGVVDRVEFSGTSQCQSSSKLTAALRQAQ